MNETGNVCVIDDDYDVRAALQLLLHTAGYPARGFASAAAFLSEVSSNTGICLVLDINMPEISGLELMQRLAARGPLPPTIVLTGYADVPLAVQAMKLGALDFIEKPFADITLLARIERAMAQLVLHNVVAEECARFGAALATLTGREREVMDRIVAGKANKVVAIDLEISERTVEIHRGRVMKKLGVHSVAELVGAVLKFNGVTQG